MRTGVLLGAVLALSIPAAALAATVTPSDPQGWTEANVRGDGASEITDTVPDSAGGHGSLQQSFSDAAGKTDYRLLDDLGPLGEVETLSFEWYRDGSSTAPGHLTPAVGLHVQDADGDSWLLKWEGVYNGYPSNGPAVPTDEWIAENLRDANFWRIPQVQDGTWVGFAGCNESGDPYGCFQFDRTLDDAFLAGHDLVGIEIGIGSGWNGSYLSYADLVTVDDVTFDFEPDPTAVILESKDDCKDGGWMTSTDPVFANQGQCVSYFQANERAGHR